jgi:hypothetical protein
MSVIAQVSNKNNTTQVNYPHLRLRGKCGLPASLTDALPPCGLLVLHLCAEKPPSFCIRRGFDRLKGLIDQGQDNLSRITQSYSAFL